MTPSTLSDNQPEWDMWLQEHKQLIEMLAFTGHEMNNILTRLILNIQRLTRELENMPSGHQRDILQTLDSNAHLLKTIAETYLNLAHIEDFSLTVNKSIIDPIKTIIHPLLTGYASLLSQRQITCRVEGESGVHIEADATLLMSACDNLLNNAIKYVNTGGEIVISISENESHSYFSIWNSGEAFDPDESKHIFERFARGKETDSQQGFGVGLYLVQRIATAHGGSISVASGTSELGTCFTLTLPKSDSCDVS